MKALNGQVAGSVLNPIDFNELPKEIENVITSTDEILKISNMVQLAQAIADYVARSNWFIDLGSLPDEVVLFRATPITPLTNPNNLIRHTGTKRDGMHARWNNSAANTGATTLIIGPGGGPAVALETEAGAALVGGELLVGMNYQCRYNLSADVFHLIGA